MYSPSTRSNYRSTSQLLFWASSRLRCNSSISPLASSSSSLLFLKLLQQIPDHASFFLFLSFVNGCSFNHLVHFRFSLRTILTTFVPRSFSTCSEALYVSTHHASFVHLPLQQVAANGISSCHTTLCFAIFSRFSVMARFESALFFSTVNKPPSNGRGTRGRERHAVHGP